MVRQKKLRLRGKNYDATGSGIADIIKILGPLLLKTAEKVVEPIGSSIGNFASQKFKEWSQSKNTKQAGTGTKQAGTGTKQAGTGIYQAGDMQRKKKKILTYL